MRLIDADKLPYEDIESINGNTYMCVNAYDIEHAPTVEMAEDCISREYLLDRWFTVFNDDGVGLRVVLKKDIEDAPSVATQRNNASEIIRRIEQARDKDKNAGEYPYNRCINIIKEVFDED